MKFSEFMHFLDEKNEHKLSSNYRKLSPRMKDAVDTVYAELEADSEFLYKLDKHIKDIAKKHKVSERDLNNYLEKEADNLFGA